MVLPMEKRLSNALPMVLRIEVRISRMDWNRFPIALVTPAISDGILVLLKLQWITVGVKHVFDRLLEFTTA